MQTKVGTIEGIGVYFAARPLISVLGVKYLHLRMKDGSDLYVTEYGLPFTKCLMPESHWADDKWMDQHSRRLPGTSAVYRATTKEVDGRSKEIIIKWNRMGQDIPGETRSLDAENAEFNSPFMEFSLVLELRNTRFESPGRVHTHKPLAIYVPRKYVAGERLGRRRHKMEAIQRNHGEIELDWNRNYAVIYEWIKGIDGAQACREGLLSHDGLTALMERSNEELGNKGFTVSDNKPQHLIVRPSNGGLVNDGNGGVLFGLVDFELLKRTPEREERIRAEKRHDYLIRQAHRFESHEKFPQDLAPVNIMGVDYVYGRVESTGGALWVVGKDPMLFEYFLPEKWRRTPRTKISSSQQQTYKTVTKDNVNLVWRVSRVGQVPDADPFVRSEARILAYGYNSPFEEVALAMELSTEGIETTYPRAIYMTGRRMTVSSSLVDHSRYESHASEETPDGQPILSRHHEYLTIWGYWNGPDDALAAKDEAVYKGMDALAAYREKRLTKSEYFRVMRATKRRLATVGIEDLSLRGNHLLLSIDREQKLARDGSGQPLVRVCNFELLRKK